MKDSGIGETRNRWGMVYDLPDLLPWESLHGVAQKGNPSEAYLTLSQGDEAESLGSQGVGSQNSILERKKLHRENIPEICIGFFSSV